MENFAKFTSERSRWVYAQVSLNFPLRFDDLFYLRKAGVS